MRERPSPCVVLHIGLSNPSEVTADESTVCSSAQGPTKLRPEWPAATFLRRGSVAPVEQQLPFPPLDPAKEVFLRGTGAAVLLAQVDEGERVPAARRQAQSERPVLRGQVAENGMLADAMEPVGGVPRVNKQDRENRRPKWWWN